MKEPGHSATQLAEPKAHAGALMEEPPDAALGAALHRGDESALAALYDRHMPAIYDYLARYLRDHHSAEDLTQVTFVRAWERRDTLREPDGVRAWLFRIAHNLATNQLTRARTADPIDERFDLAAPGPGPEQEAVSREAAELVWSAASSLEPRQYEILDLCIRHDLSTREVAEVMDLQVGHAAVLVNRAREALANAVRYLLVARRREHCERLAALVPAGVRSLTPELRSAVDHHMRRCDDCRSLGRRLTTPAELFGGLVALPVPESLHGPGRDYVLRSARRLQGGGARLSLRSRRGALAGIAVVALGLLTLTTALFVHSRSDAATSGAPFSPAVAPSSAPPLPTAGSVSGSPSPQSLSAADGQQPASGPVRPSLTPAAAPTTGPTTTAPTTGPTTEPQATASPSTAPSSGSSSPGAVVKTQPPTPAPRDTGGVVPPRVSP